MATTIPSETAELADLNDPDAFVGGIPHETFAYWRANDPVHWTEHPIATGYWSVTTYDEVVAVSRDAETFQAWLDRHVYGTDDFAEHLQLVRDDALVTS